MKTLQGMRMETQMMMDKIQMDAINQTYSDWVEAVRNYYLQGYDNGETTKLYKDLERLGANMGMVIDADLAIRDEIERTKKVLEDQKQKIVDELVRKHYAAENVYPEERVRVGYQLAIKDAIIAVAGEEKYQELIQEVVE